MVSRDAYQKLCDLIADLGSSSIAVGRLKIILHNELGLKKEKSSKLQA